jgi:hypothetical protein
MLHTYLHHTNEAQILYYVWFNPIGGLRDLEMTSLIELLLLPLLCMKIISKWKGKTIFLFTLPCFGLRRLQLQWFSLPEEKRLNAIALLQHGHSTREVSKLLGISQSTCSRICRDCVPHVEPSRGGCPSNITPIHR